MRFFPGIGARANKADPMTANARQPGPIGANVATLAYARISREDRDTGSLSLDWQDASVQTFCLSRKWGGVIIHADNGVSGSVPLAERPEGKKLIEAARKGPCRIVVAKLDRAFRNLLDFCINLAQWDTRGVKLYTVAEGFDLYTNYGRAMASMTVVFAELERSLTVERIRAGYATRRAKGQRSSETAVYGTRFVDSGTIGANGEPILLVEKDPAEQEVIAKMKLWRRNKASYRDICKRLAREGVPTRKGGPWTPAVVFQTLERAKRNQGDS